MPLEDYEEFYDEDEVRAMQHDKFMEQKRNDRRRKRSAKKTDILNEVGVVPDPTPERLEKIDFYKNNYVQMHYDIFTRSTGIKQFGAHQVESIKRSQDVIDHGGRLISIEPRGFAKTSRTSNHALAAVLQGKLKYTLILASTVRKAGEILESIKSELMDNEKLFELYPATLSCFQHLDEKPIKARTQTYNGAPTHIGWGMDRIRFPIIDGEPSSGSIIQVRSKDNVRGLFTKVRYGPESGKVLRPDFVFLDDIQTDEEARNAETVEKIVKDIKKSVLFAGSHSKRISALMCATPICIGDVTSRFALYENAWEVIQYKMLEQMPDNLKLWLTEYAEILQAYDRFERGSRKRAQLRAKQYVLDHYEELHRGAKWAWDWAYGWEEDPQTEVSALHHAMNFLIEEGQDSFESECQCSVTMPDSDEQSIKATVIDVKNHITTTLQKFEVPLDTQFIVTHVDINSEILTSVTCASGSLISPYITNYETHPPQDGAIWAKGNIYKTLSNLYPEIPKAEIGLRIYQAVKDYLTMLYSYQFRRADGILMQHSLILVDCNYEKEEVMKAITDLPFSTSIQPAFGTGIVAKDRPMMEKNYGTGCMKYHHCVNLPHRGYNMMNMMMDVNYFKKRVHDGFKTRVGWPGAISLFPESRLGEHDVFIRHICKSEEVEKDYYEKEDRTVYVFQQVRGQDNEFFDNLVGCLAGFCRLGAKFRQQERKKKKPIDMDKYLNDQENKE